MQLYVYGASGFGREVEQLALQCGHRVAAFVDDHADLYPDGIHGKRVLSPADALDEADTHAFVIAIGNPQARRAVTERLLGYGLRLQTLIHSTVIRGENVQIGEGSIICAGCILTTDIHVGRGVILNLTCTVGHDCVLGDYVSAMPAVNISGGVEVGADTYFGTNACVRNGKPDEPLVIGSGVTVGMGAVVVKPIADGVTVVGNPAKAPAS